MNETPTYRFGPRRESGVLGLARSQLAIVSTSVVLALLAVLGARQILAGFGLLALGAVVAFAPAGGRPLVTWIGPLARRLSKPTSATAPLRQHGLRAGAGIDPPAPTASVPWQLPGLGRLVIWPALTYLGEVGVADVTGSRRSASLTFVLTGPRFGLADADEQARAVASWGQLLGALARDSRQLQRLQLTERVVPDDLKSQQRFLAPVAASADPSSLAIYRAQLESLEGRGSSS